MIGIAWLVQILNKIGVNSDAAAMNTTLFAGQQEIHDDIAAAASAQALEASLTAIKGAGWTNETLKAIKDIVAALPTTSPSPIMMLTGTCDAGMSASKTSIVSAELAGYGNDFFNNKYYLGVLLNANSAGNAPEREWRLITDYVSSSGTFTIGALSANAEASDELLVLHESLMPDRRGLVFTGKCNADMSASTTSIVIGAMAGLGDDFFNTKYWMKVVKNANSVGNAPEMEIRQITDYVSATGTFTTVAFSANVEASDEVTILHDSLPFPKYVEYTSGSGNWTAPRGANFVDVLIVAGGGNSANGNSGAGGGGEVVSVVDYPVTPGTAYAYVVGGAAASSSFSYITASPGVSGSNTQGGAGGGSFTYAAGGAAGSPGEDGKAAGGNKISRYGGGGGGTNTGTGYAGGASYFAAGGAPSGGYCGGGASWKAGANADTQGAANSGAGAGGSSSGVKAGGTGYILIIWR